MDEKIPFCSFCGKTASQVKKLIAASKEDTFICDECVELCCEILDEDEHNHGALKNICGHKRGSED